MKDTYRRISRSGPALKYGAIYSGVHWVGNRDGVDVVDASTKTECIEAMGRFKTLVHIATHGVLDVKTLRKMPHGERLEAYLSRNHKAARQARQRKTKEGEDRP